MVLLAMTPAVVAAVSVYNELHGGDAEHDGSSEPSLNSPEPGQPISHGQLIEISRYLRSKHDSAIIQDGDQFAFSLDRLLRGCDVYRPPPPPKSEPTSEYKALMARLRKEQEARDYDRMTAQSAQSASIQAGFRSRQSAKQLLKSDADEDDDMTYADVNRQLTLIMNVLVTIVACGIGIWLVASRWSTPTRLALSMCGSGLVGVAEVVIYAGYIRRIGEAKSTERKIKEQKSIASSWVIEGKRPPAPSKAISEGLKSSEISSNDNLRRRKAG